jgi:hypothetical protein
VKAFINKLRISQRPNFPVTVPEQKGAYYGHLAHPAHIRNKLSKGFGIDLPKKYVSVLV